MLGELAYMWSRMLRWVAVTTHVINLKPGVPPSYQIPYFQVPKIRDITQRHIDEQLKAGVIEAENVE